METLRNIDLVIYDSHLTYFCIVQTQNINAVNRLIILQKKALQTINVQDRIFQSSHFFSKNNISRLGFKNYLRKYTFRQ